MNRSANVVAKHGQVFAKVETISKLVDGFLTARNFCKRRSTLQPCCKRLFARTRARLRKQFEQGSLPEDVEIDAIRMRFFEERAAGISSTDPTIFNSR